MIVKTIITAVTVLSQRKLNEPSLISKDLLKFSSIRPPRTNAKINGGIGNLYKRRPVATIAIPIIKNISNVLNDIR